VKSIENTAYALPLYSAILRCITSCFTSKVEFCNDANHISGFFTVSTFPYLRPSVIPQTMCVLVCKDECCKYRIYLSLLARQHLFQGSSHHLVTVTVHAVGLVLAGSDRHLSQLRLPRLLSRQHRLQSFRYQ